MAEGRGVPQGYLDEEFDYDVVTTTPSPTSVPARPSVRSACAPASRSRQDLWWNWMRKRTTNTCDATSVFVSDYCGHLA